MLPPRVSEHNWWWCAWRSKTPQWPHWLAERGCRDHEPASVHWLQTWHRPGGVQITGTPVTGSRTGIICTVKTPGDARGLRLCYANETWLVTLIPMLVSLPVTDPGILLRCYCRVLAEWTTLYQGVRVWSQLLLDHMECHKIIGREKYYERLSFIDAIWKVGHVIIYIFSSRVNK